MRLPYMRQLQQNQPREAQRPQEEQNPEQEQVQVDGPAQDDD